MTYENDAKAVDALKQNFDRIMTEVKKVIIGQDDVVKSALLSVFSGGHCLLVGVPGLAKTLLVNTIADTLGLQYSRIQFTPDLMPSDITGSEILNDKREFKFIKGPIFANIILADEINRTPPKTQSALLEAMQERNVTVAGVRNSLPEPFFVLATQNPIEQEGTYPLPEAQLDRFMFMINLDYPTIDDEINIVTQTTSELNVKAEPIISADELVYFQQLVRRIPVNENVVRYAVNIAAQTRPGTQAAAELTSKYLTWGAGPRASQYLVLGAKAHAAVNGKYSPDAEDVRAVAPLVLRHRIVRNYKAEAEGVSTDNVIEKILQSVKF
ncbi:MAG: AAA family ATPase [Salinivirgaceae bacterium]|nr:AAA family ATPase [Salinivirgaceae bacterium]